MIWLKNQKKEEIKDLIEWICLNGKDWIKKGILPYPTRPDIGIGGEIVEHIFQILNNEPAETVWSNYIDYFIQISLWEYVFSPRTFLRMMILDLKTEFSKILDFVSKKTEISLISLQYFLQYYFEKIGDLKFDEDIFNKIYHLFEKAIEANSQRICFKLPILNFIALGKEIGYKEIKFRVTDIENEEIFCISMPNMEEYDIPRNPKYLTLLPEPRFIIDGYGYLAGALASYVFEWSCIHSIEERNEVDTKLITIWRENLEQYEELSREFLLFFEKKGNNYAKALLVKDKLLDSLYFSLRLFKNGDFRILGLFEEKNGLNLIVSNPIMTLNPKDLPDYKRPYLLDKKEVFEFIKFWEEFFLCSVADQPIFFMSLRVFSRACEKIYSEDCYFDFYLVVELLLSTDFTRSSGKAKAIDRRIGKLLEHDPLFALYSEEIIQNLRRVRNDLAHTGKVNQTDRDDLIKKLSSCANSLLTEDDIPFYLMEYIRLILWSFWGLLKQNNYEEQKCFQIISQY